MGIFDNGIGSGSELKASQEAKMQGGGSGTGRQEELNRTSWTSRKAFEARKSRDLALPRVQKR
jgi:hypothetical protein